MESTRFSLFRKGIRDSFPIGLGYLAVSFAFGIAAKSAGLSLLETVMISAVNLTSAGQLAAVPIIAACGSFTELILTQIVINLRYSLMSVSLSQKLDPEVTVADRFLIGMSVTDEIYAVEIGQKGSLRRVYLFSMLIVPWLGWTLGTACGALAGSILPSFVISALGLMLYAMFIAIVIPVGRDNRAVAFCIAVSILLSCLFRYVPFLNRVKSGFVIILCAVICGVLCSLLFPIPDEKEDAKDA